MAALQNHNYICGDLNEQPVDRQVSLVLRNANLWMEVRGAVPSPPQGKYIPIRMSLSKTNIYGYIETNIRAKRAPQGERTRKVKTILMIDNKLDKIIKPGL